MSSRLVLALLFTSACSGAPAGPPGSAGDPDASASADGSFAGDPYVSVSSDNGGLKLDVRTDPQPPPRGTCTAEITIPDANGAPQDGLTLAIVPWMPAMGHGSSIRTSVAPL